jgi:hypothetical protein
MSKPWMPTTACIVMSGTFSDTVVDAKEVGLLESFESEATNEVSNKKRQ